MKIEVFRGAYQPKEKSPLRLQLKQEGKTVRVIVVDAEGRWEQNLVAFYQDGKMYRHVLSETFLKNYDVQVDRDRRIWLRGFE